MNRAALAQLRFGQLPAETGHDSLFQGFLQPGTDAWNEYFSTRKIVKQPLSGGGGVLAVSSNLNDVVAPEEVVQQSLVEVMTAQAQEEAEKVSEEIVEKEPERRRAPRKYELVNILTDRYIFDKFGFTEALLNTLKNMAVAQPDQAAARAQAVIRERPGMEDAVVTAGKYSRSKHWARASVRAHAGRFSQRVAASEALVVGEKIIVYGPSGRGGWFVTGPTWFTGEIVDVHRIVYSAGTSSTMLGLGSELTILNIDIHNGSSFESPSIHYHGGSQEHLPLQSSPVTGSVLSFEGRQILSSFVHSLEVVEVGGNSVNCCAYFFKACVVECTCGRRG